jgi:hypothetical protein
MRANHPASSNCTRSITLVTIYPTWGTLSSLLIFLQFAGVGREQAERCSGNIVKQALPMSELRRQGSLLPAYKTHLN